MEYAVISTGIIEKIISTNDKPSKNWKPINFISFDGYPGMPEVFIDWKTGKIRPEEELIADGLLEDNRGKYWQKSTKMPYEITDIGQPVPEGFTDKEPPESLFAFWDEKADGWDVDHAAEEEARLQGIRERRRYEFQTFDKYKTILWDDLDSKQKSEYEKWRQMWLDAPETGKEPERPMWFKEF